MQYGLAFSYVTSRRGGVGNLLLLTVCQFIPIVGPVLLLGYRGDVAEALLRDPELRRHPKFDFGRFGDYLGRGIWPFLMGLLVTLPLVFVVIAAVVAGVVIDPPAAGGPPVLALALGGVAYLVVIAAAFALYPMTYHAQLTARFDLGGAFAFTRAFWSLVGGQAVVAGLVFVPWSALVFAAGMLACFVGIYPATILTQMASEHLMVQLYREYVARGGESITEDEPPPADDDEYETDDRRGDEW